MLRNIYDKKKIFKKVDIRDIPDLKIFEEPIEQFLDLPTLRSDLTSSFEAIEIKATNLLNQIKQENSSKEFIEYFDFISQTYWNPLTLKDDPKARPPSYSTIQAKILERKVFQTTSNEQAYWVQDIFRILQDTQSWQYAVETIWDRVDWPDNSPVSAYISDQIRKGLLYNESILNRIEVLPKTTFIAINVLMQYYVDKLAEKQDSEEVQEVAEEVEGLGAVTEHRGVKNIETWEAVSEKTRELGGRPFWSAVERTLYLTTAAFIDTQTDNLIKMLDSVLNSLTTPAVHQILYQSVSRALVDTYADIETYLVNHMNSQDELYKQRTLLLQTSAVNSVVKGTGKKVKELHRKINELKNKSDLHLGISELREQYEVI